jgi:ferredoxin
VEGQLARIIDRRDLDEWVGRLLKQQEVMAPVQGEGTDTLFAPVRTPTDVLWDFENPLLPPRHALLPQTDPIVRISRTGGHYDVQPAPDPPERVLLNVRSCDVVGLQYLRKVHEQDLPDDALIRRARSLTVVSHACDRPCREGFCICTESGPFLRSGYDVQLTDLGDKLLAEAGTPEGVTLLEQAADLFRPAPEAAVEARRERERATLERFGSETCHFGSAMRRISTRRVPDELWDSMSRWCLECGGCTFVCPTCYCFSVADRAEAENAWVRYRTWDSCQYEAFTLEASGHNPRALRRERMKRRFFHKVSAQYYVREDRVGCVGCGRCIRACMGTTDMPAVVRAIRKGVWEGGRAV